MDLAEVLNVDFDTDHLLGGIILGARDAANADFGIDQPGGKAGGRFGHENPERVPPTGEANDDLAGIGVSDGADNAVDFDESRIFGGGSEEGEIGTLGRGKRDMANNAGHGVVQVPGRSRFRR